MNNRKYCYFYGTSESDCYNTQSCDFFIPLAEHLIDKDIYEEHERLKNEYYDAWQDYIKDYN